MGDFGKYSIHPVAALFPMVDGEAFKQLVADIKANGLIEPITLGYDESMLIDGRNRYRACLEAGVDPRYTRLGKHYDALAIIEFIISKNLRRRHMDAGQRSFLGLGLLPHYEAAAKERQREHGKTAPGRKTLPQKSAGVSGDARDLVAAAVNVSHDSISKAKAVKENAVNLVDDVMAGKISLNEAHKEAKKAKQSKPIEDEPKAFSKTHITLRTHLDEAVEYPLPKGKAKFNPANKHISWAAWTWNPVTGCLHGCKYCYARELALRDSYKATYPVGFTPIFHHERLEAPANTEVPDGVAQDSIKGRVFVCSMADLYGKWVPDDWIERVHASCIANPQWEYLMLTKFPRRYVGLELPATAWLGTSVDEQKRVRLAEDAFRQIDGVRVKWLSLEPLLAPLEFSDLSMFDWVVIGSQSPTEQPWGHVPAFAPPIEWVARLTDQAREAGCRVYHKHNLMELPPGMKMIREEPSLPMVAGRQAGLFEAAE